MGLITVIRNRTFGCCLFRNLTVFNFSFKEIISVSLSLSLSLSLLCDSLKIGKLCKERIEVFFVIMTA